LVIAVMVCLMGTETACVAPPSVKPTCTISWDEGDDHPQISEYRLTVWMVNGQQASIQTTLVVKAPTTQVSCQEVGANEVGQWHATIQACLNNGVCSEASKPLSFKVVEK
jgi:hypothetical protein